MKIKIPHISIEITSKCNLSCKYCYNIWKTDDSKFEHFDSYKKAIKTLKKLFKIAEIDYVAFTGGEPLLSERFLEVVLYCRLKNKSVTIISNGNFASNDDYKTLINMGVSLFEFPVHSAEPKAHDYMTSKEGTWQKSIDTIKFVMGSGGNVVPVIVITKANYGQIHSTLKFIKELGLSRVMVNRYNIGGTCANNPELLLMSVDELRNTYKTINKCVTEYGLNITSNVCTPACVLNPDDFPDIGFGFCSNNVLSRPLTIDVNGNLRLCNHSPVIAGNIFKKKNKKILNSDYVDKWEKDIPEFCSDCNKWKMCMGGCRAASEQVGSQLSSADPIIKYLNINKLPHQKQT